MVPPNPVIGGASAPPAPPPMITTGYFSVVAKREGVSQTVDHSMPHSLLRRFLQTTDVGKRFNVFMLVAFLHF